MKRFLIPVFIALIVSSCATVEGYKKTLQTWIGSSEGALIQSWGPPSSVYVSGGRKCLTYNKSRSGYVPGTSPNYTTTLIGNSAYTTSSGGSPGFAYMKLCKTTFTISGNSIIAYRFEGNDCTAKAPKTEGWGRMKDYKEPNHEGNDNKEIKCHMLDHNFVTNRGDCNNQGGRISPL